MKKIITGTLVGITLFSSGVFATEMPVKIMESTLFTTDLVKSDFGTVVDEIAKKHEIVLRNNILKLDDEYNTIHYYTSKLDTKDIIVPKEIKDKAKRIYFLVEEGLNNIFYATDSLAKSELNIQKVNTEYNYKTVNFIENKQEYLFNNTDLVKDFGNDEYKNVNITLMAEFSDTQRLPLSNTVYVNIGDKKNVFDQIQNKKNKDEIYYGYFNSDNIEKYLETFANKITRIQYKNLLLKADKKILDTNKANEDSMKKILDSINIESDFIKYLDSYKTYTDTKTLFVSLGNAVKNQIKNVRAYDALDSILK